MVTKRLKQCASALCLEMDPFGWFLSYLHVYKRCELHWRLVSSHIHKPFPNIPCEPKLNVVKDNTLNKVSVANSKELYSKRFVRLRICEL